MNFKRRILFDGRSDGKSRNLINFLVKNQHGTIFDGHRNIIENF